jgi:hypothetical protein
LVNATTASCRPRQCPGRGRLLTELVIDGCHGLASSLTPRDRRSVPMGRAFPPFAAVPRSSFVASKSIHIGASKSIHIGLFWPVRD